jgi:hypothetical protein
MSDKPRYEWDPEEGFFVDTSKPDENGLGEQLPREEVLALLNQYAALEAKLETYIRMNLAVRDALERTQPGWEGSGRGIVETIEHYQAKLENLPGGSPEGAWELVRRMRLHSAALEAKLEAMELVIEAATNFAASGYAEPQMDWRKPLIDALAAAQEELGK